MGNIGLTIIDTLQLWHGVRVPTARFRQLNAELTANSKWCKVSAMAYINHGKETLITDWDTTLNGLFSRVAITNSSLSSPTTWEMLQQVSDLLPPTA